MADELNRKVYARIPYLPDKEVHVSVVEAREDGKFVDAREYIPSLDAYGRGLTFPMSLLSHFMDGLEDIWEGHGAGEKGTPTEPPRG
ncbi:hypothetical protein PV336_15780 [Streptomyces sp. MI02-2A]|uniref:hypothetical protein n=1 Tax=Streptomyces sp. MI02-2A TaxID=3028688 RepID=UPI0029A10D22|nr:hypothetical protein [Streptomyces sp. MI02-2A]MDX3260679.1 hypothetical protein [Streptomyces sp. MI02-2A]